MHHSVHPLKATVFAVAIAGLTTVLSCALAPIASAVPTTTPTAGTAAMAGPGASDDWFVDPRTRVERRAEIAVPRDAKGYDGRVRETRAVYRTHAGDLAVPVHYAFGRTVEKGQALTLDRNGLFLVNTDDLTAQARQQLRRLALALANASSIRCEGYADYAGAAKRNRDLARGRAEAVCSALAAENTALRTDTTAYGPTHPAVVGGNSADRRLNRRVVVQMTGTRPASPPPPATPLPTAPGAPDLTTVDGQRGSLAFSFVAPAEDGGSPITGYEVSVGDGWLPVPAVPSIHQAATLSGLAPGLKTLRVRAVNTIGAGAPSNSLDARVFDVPSAPTGLTVAGDDGVLTTTFGLPESDGGSPVTRFEISYDGGQTWEQATTGGDAPWTVVRGGFANGTVYNVRLRASNAWGPGPMAAAEALVATVPGAPNLAVPELDDRTAVLTFEPPTSDGGQPVTSYQFSLDLGETWTNLPYSLGDGSGTFKGMVDGLEYGHAYSVQVRAVNSRGNGSPSQSRTVTAVTTPDAPTQVQATAQGTAVSVSFTAPTFDGGTQVTGYQVRVDNGSWAPVTLLAGGMSFQLAGQSVGTHTYEVRAVNDHGVSPASNTSTAEIAAVQPNAPTIRNFGYNSFFLVWEVSFDAGAANGATITGYEVSVNGGPWTPAAEVLAVNGQTARFPCSDGGCGWSYSTPVRLRAVTAAGASEPSQPYVHDDF